MSLANSFEEFKREINLILKQNPSEFELYSIVASIIRERDSGKDISLRDVSSLQQTPNNQNQKDRMYRTAENTFGATDFLIIDPTYSYSESPTNKILGTVEIKAIYVDLSESVKKNSIQFLGELQTFKKLIYTNGIMWRLYNYNFDSQQAELVWEKKLGTYCFANSIEISDSDTISWDDVNEWYGLLAELDKIDWRAV